MVRESGPVFGTRKSDRHYTSRPGAYAVLQDTEGRIAVMETPRGCFLPGGGSDGDETPEETLRRELLEECGFDVQITLQVGEAVEYVYTEGHELGIRKECVFFSATVTKTDEVPTETDHVLVWLEPHHAQDRLAHGSQKWALSQVAASQDPAKNNAAHS